MSECWSRAAVPISLRRARCCRACAGAASGQPVPPVQPDRGQSCSRARIPSCICRSCSRRCRRSIPTTRRRRLRTQLPLISRQRGSRPGSRRRQRRCFPPSVSRAPRRKARSPLSIPTRNRVGLLRAVALRPSLRRWCGRRPKSSLSTMTRPIRKPWIISPRSTARSRASCACPVFSISPGSITRPRRSPQAIISASSITTSRRSTIPGLEEMLSRIAEPDVGAVGATLLWPTGIIQHAGVVLGPNLGAVHAFNDRMQDDCGYADMLSVARECSAVTAACLLTRKADYLAVGGMDEIFFPVNFNDVDYCLKLRALGRRVVVTPHARSAASGIRQPRQRPERRSRRAHASRVAVAAGALAWTHRQRPLLQSVAVARFHRLLGVGMAAARSCRAAQSADAAGFDPSWDVAISDGCEGAGRRRIVRPLQRRVLRRRSRTYAAGFGGSIRACIARHAAGRG